MLNKKNDFFNPYKKNKVQKKAIIKNQSKKRSLDALISWKINNHEKNPKSLKFLLSLYSVLFLIAIYGLLTNNLLLSILIILFGFTFFIFEKKPPQLILFAITEEGIFIHDHLYPYDSLKSFWIEYQPEGEKTVSFKNNQLFLPYIKIPLKKTNPVKLRKILIKFIPEEEQSENFTNIIEKF